MNNLDPMTIAWMVFWVGSCLGVIFGCGYMANRKPSDDDLDVRIIQAQARLDELVIERGKRRGRAENAALTKPVSPTFQELRDSHERMDN